MANSTIPIVFFISILLPLVSTDADPVKYDAIFSQQARLVLKTLTPTKESEIDKGDIKWSYDDFKAGYFQGVAFVQTHRQLPFICGTGVKRDEWSGLYGYGQGSIDAFDQLTRVYRSCIERLHTEDYGRDVIIGRNLMFHALRVRDVCGLELLLSRGANVLAVNQWKERPLDIAIAYSDLEAVRVLLKYKAPIAVKGDKVTAVHSANGREMLTELLKHCGDIRAFEQATSSLAAAFVSEFSSDEGLLKLVLDRGADPNAKDGEGNSCLHRAPSASVARLLIKYGANVNQLNANGATPLDVCHDTGMIALLTKHGGKLKVHKNDPLWTVAGLHAEMLPIELEDKPLDDVLLYIERLSKVTIQTEWKLLAEVGVKPNQKISMTIEKGETARSALKRLVKVIKPGWLEVRVLSPIRVEIRPARVN